MFDLELRELKNKLLLPLTNGCAFVHPIVVSVLACVLGLLSAFFSGLGYVYLSAMFWGFNRVLDGLDGIIARRFHKVTDFGGLIDITLDFTVYCAIPLSFLVENSLSTSLAVSALISSFAVNAVNLFYLSSVLEKRGRVGGPESTSVTMPRSLVEGGETVLLFTVMILWKSQRVLICWIFTILVMVTLSIRLRWAYKVLKTQQYTK